jgi:hypothetical protein
MFTERCLVALSKDGFIVKEVGPLTIGIRKAGFSAVQEFRDLYSAYLLEDPRQVETLIAGVVSDLSRKQSKVTESQEIMSPAVVFPMLRKSEAVGSDSVSQTAFGGVRIVYAADLPTHWQFIDQELLDAWEVTLDTLHQLALDNLRRRTAPLSPTVIPGDPPFKIFATADGFDAARALILSEIEPMAQSFTFAVPTRSQLLYVPSSRLPDAFTLALRAQVEQDYQTLDHPVSPHLWTMSGGEIHRVD